MQIDNLLSRTIIYIVMHQAVCAQSLGPCDLHIDIHRHIKLLSVRKLVYFCNSSIVYYKIFAFTFELKFSNLC